MSSVAPALLGSATRKGGDMLRKFKLFGAAVVASGALAAGIGAPVATAHSVITGGLVNVTITDLLNNNTVTVQVPRSARRSTWPRTSAT